MPQCPFCNEPVEADSAACPGCGAPLDAISASDQLKLQAQVRELLDSQRKIEAVKLYREQTGASLAEAKDAIEAFDADGVLPVAAKAVLPAGDWEAEALRLLREGNKIQAIRLYRTQHGVGLKDSKDAIDALAVTHGIEAKGSGCFGMLLMLLGTGAAMFLRW